MNSIENMLKTGVMEDGILVMTTKGTPRGMKLCEDKTKLTTFKRGFRFLGYTFTGKYKDISTKSMDKIKDTIRDVTKHSQGVNLKAVIGNVNPVIRGHVNYFRLGNVQTVYHSLDRWVRMRRNGDFFCFYAHSLLDRRR